MMVGGGVTLLVLVYTSQLSQSVYSSAVSSALAVVMTSHNVHTAHPALPGVCLTGGLVVRKPLPRSQRAGRRE